MGVSAESLLDLVLEKWDCSHSFRVAREELRWERCWKSAGFGGRCASALTGETGQMTGPGVPVRAQAQLESGHKIQMNSFCCPDAGVKKEVDKRTENFKISAQWVV